MKRSIWWLLAMSLLVACGEQTLVRTSPPGASLYVNEAFIGVTPVVYSVSRSQFEKDHRYRIELQGYELEEGTLPKRVGPSRIVGAIFTSGISLIFKRPTTFRDRFDFALRPAVAEEHPAERGAGARPTDSEAKLRQIQDLYDRGLISEQEYRRARSNVLDGL